jgi:hypothetical protein
MDVEYVPLETTDEFLNQGRVQAVGREIILVTNRNRDGDIFVYDRAGKAVRKINRMGQGGEEYVRITEIIPDEDSNEMFVVDYTARKISVYDLYGNFKRSFKFADTGYYTYIFNYDRDNLICYMIHVPAGHEQSCHLIVSKRDGSITREIQIPLKELKTPTVIMGDATVTPTFHTTIQYRSNWVLANTSSDTVYNCLSDDNLKPLIVRTPSIHSMDPEVFLFPTTLTDRYYFMRTVKKEFDLTTMRGFPGTDLVYDRQEKAIFEYTVYNDDYSNKEQVSMNTISVNDEIATWLSLEAHHLVESYEKGELQGRLKEIAAGLDEESNPVVMLVKHRK